MSQALVLIGLACIIAAIVGGGMKLFQIEIPTLLPVRRQALPATLGVVLAGGVGVASLLDTRHVSTESQPPPSGSKPAPANQDAKPSRWMVSSGGTSADPVGRAWYVAYGAFGSDQMSQSTWQNVSASDIPLSSLAFGDFNGDGKEDVLYASDGQWMVSYSDRQ